MRRSSTWPHSQRRRRVAAKFSDEESDRHRSRNLPDPNRIDGLGLDNVEGDVPTTSIRPIALASAYLVHLGAGGGSVCGSPSAGARCCSRMDVAQVTPLPGGGRSLRGQRGGVESLVQRVHDPVRRGRGRRRPGYAHRVAAVGDGHRQAGGGTARSSDVPAGPPCGRVRLDGDVGWAEWSEVGDGAGELRTDREGGAMAAASKPHVVIIGGGSAGLSAARRLRDADVAVHDRR